MPVLDVQNLRAGYRGAPIIEDLSFGVESGEIFGVLGPNGSGKTTLLKVISKALRPRGGRILLNGNDLSGMTQLALSRAVAVVPQVTHVEFNFTAREIAAMGRNPHQKRMAFDDAEDERIVRESMEATETWHLRDRPFRVLSGGESQRVLVARCLAQRCALMLLDEPTAHLDIKYQAEIFNLLRGLRDKRGITIVVSTHDLNMAAMVCDRVLLMRRGSRAALGAPREVITPDAVREVFDAPVRVNTDPDTGAPFVVPEY